MSGVTTRPFDLVLFDLDGTLIETAPEITDAVNDTLRELSLPEVQQALVNDWIGHGTGELLVQALAFARQCSIAEVRTAPDQAATSLTFARHYQARCGTRSHLYPEVRETLHHLRDRGIRLALVTNKETRFTQTVLQGHKLFDAFDSIVCGDTLPTKKPDPAGVLQCLQRFKILPGRALFVGDSSIDVQTARNAGVRVWALPYGYNMGQPIMASAPDRVIPGCAALLED